MQRIPCPFTDPNGRQCIGHIKKVLAYKADLAWELDKLGNWNFHFGYPRSDYHQYCSEKGNHGDSDKMKFRHLPDGLPLVPN